MTGHHYAMMLLAWARSLDAEPRLTFDAWQRTRGCASCNRPVAPGLARLGGIQCHDCRPRYQRQVERAS